MTDPKGTYNSPSAQGWATVLPSGPNFMGMATSMQNQELRKQLAEQAAAEKRRADRDKGIADLLRDFSKPATTHQKYQSMVSADFRALQEEIAKGIAEGRDLSEIRTSAAIKYQELKGEAEAGKGVMALVNAVDAMNKGKDYQRYNVGKIKEYYADRLVGEDGKLLPPSQVRIEDLYPDKVLYGQGSAGAQFLNKQDVVNSFVNSDAMKEISVKWRNNPSQSRSGGMLTTTQSGFNQTAKPFQVLDIDKQGKVKVGIMSPEQLLESGVYLAAANDKDMGLLIDAAADEFFSKRLVPPTKQEREYEEARILGEMLTGQVGGASYDRFMSSKVQNPPRSGGSGRLPQWAQQEAMVASGTTQWEQDVTSRSLPLVREAIMFSAKKGGISQTSLSPIHELTGMDPETEISNVTFVRPSSLEKTVPYSDMDPMQPWADSVPDDYKLFIEFKDPGAKRGRWVEIDQRSLSDERTRAALNKLQEGVGYGYKQRSPNPINPNTPQTIQKGRYD